MLLGILSDSHDRYEMMAQAVTVLRARGARFLIHCGDVGSPRMLDHLAGIPSAVVWGNCDWDRAGLARYGRAIDVPFHGELADFEIAGKHIAVTHGDDNVLMQRLLAEQRHDYLFCGHTHVKRDERIGRVRIVNPGALFRAAQKTVGLLETTTDQLEFLVIA
jgi:putative phosphoesterase